MKSTGNSSIFLTWLYSQGYNIYTINTIAPLSITFAKCLEGVVSCTISSFIFVDIPYRPTYNTDKFISCVVLDPSQWFFHFGEDIEIAWTHIG